MKQIMMTIMMLCLTLQTAGTLRAYASDSDIVEIRHCRHCGMDRKMYAMSRMLLVYEDGTRSGVCSIHCAAIDMNGRKGEKPLQILVADRVSRELIPAAAAFWVMGGNRRGVMTSNPKWAFSTIAAAEAFVREYGGRLAGWDEILAAAMAESRHTAP